MEIIVVGVFVVDVIKVKGATADVAEVQIIDGGIHPGRGHLTKVMEFIAVEVRPKKVVEAEVVAVKIVQSRCGESCCGECFLW